LLSPDVYTPIDATSGLYSLFNNPPLVAAFRKIISSIILRLSLFNCPVPCNRDSCTVKVLKTQSLDCVSIFAL
jgi:hypothetical protein